LAEEFFFLPYFPLESGVDAFGFLLYPFTDFFPVESWTLMKVPSSAFCYSNLASAYDFCCWFWRNSSNAVD
jgi:hypothetical protein